MIGDILQPTHLLIILAVALLVMGPKRLPEAGKALGHSIHGFRSGLSGIGETGSDQDASVEVVERPDAGG